MIRKAAALANKNAHVEYRCKSPKVKYGDWPVCTDFIDWTNCLVYSVGIAGDFKLKCAPIIPFMFSGNWVFDKAMAEKGCEVFSFDPTIQDPKWNFNAKVEILGEITNSKQYHTNKTTHQVR